VDAIFCSDLALKCASGVLGSNRQNGILTQFRRWLTTASHPPTFLHHVSRVVGLGPAEEVTESDATEWATVTVMQDHRGRRLTELNEPRSTVSKHVLGGDAGVDLAVAFVTASTDPDPAWPKIRSVGWNRAVLVDFGPEPISKRQWMVPTSFPMSIRAGTITEHSALLSPARGNDELKCAPSTDHVHDCDCTRHGGPCVNISLRNHTSFDDVAVS
jgi:hypothetical protein